MDTFGDRLRAARKAQGLTQEDVAERVEVTKSAVSGWENNRETPSLDKLPRLRGVLRTSIDVLVDPLDTARDPDMAGRWVGDSSAGAPYGTPRSPDLAPEEVKLLRLFGTLDARRRRALLQLLET